MTRSALITGVLGQDGAYLARLLLQNGYSVLGLDHGGDRWRLAELGIIDEVQLVEGDLRSSELLNGVLSEHRPDEVYNLAAMSSVGASFSQPVATTQVTALGAMRLLEAVRAHLPNSRFCQASSSEMYGPSAPSPQDETTPFAPTSPYGAAKLHAHQLTRSYRQAYGSFACCAILFNHDSPLRGPTFVTRKITRAVAAIAAGRQREIRLGNLDARRDFGYAPEYVEAMWLMLQRDQPADYVIATGEAHAVRDFAETAFRLAGLSLDDHLVTDPGLLRPSDPGVACGNPEKARRQLGWRARTGFEELIRIMVDADRQRLERRC